jgi:hypothetical protein
MSEFIGLAKDAFIAWRDNAKPVKDSGMTINIDEDQEAFILTNTGKPAKKNVKVKATGPDGETVHEWEALEPLKEGDSTGLKAHTFFRETLPELRDEQEFLDGHIERDPANYPIEFTIEWEERMGKRHTTRIDITIN